MWGVRKERIRIGSKVPALAAGWMELTFFGDQEKEGGRRLDLFVCSFRWELVVSILDIFEFEILAAI